MQYLGKARASNQKQPSITTNAHITAVEHAETSSDIQTDVNFGLKETKTALDQDLSYPEVDVTCADESECVVQQPTDKPSTNIALSTAQATVMNAKGTTTTSWTSSSLLGHTELFNRNPSFGYVGMEKEKRDAPLGVQPCPGWFI